MQVVKEHRDIIADRYFTDISDYIRIMIDVYSSTMVDRDKWLTEREKEFFISTVIHYLRGHRNPISEEALQIYKIYFNPKTNNIKVSDYINRVRKKNWIKYNKRKKEVSIPPIFEEISVDGDKVTFNLTFSYEQQINRRDSI